MGDNHYIEHMGAVKTRLLMWQAVTAILGTVAYIFFMEGMINNRVSLYAIAGIALLIVIGFTISTIQFVIRENKRYTAYEKSIMGS